MKPEQRKLLSNLHTSGTALIAFALLDAIKLAIYWAIDPIQRFVLELIFEADKTWGWIFVGVVAGATLLEVILGSLIGFSARDEAKGKKRNIFYVVVAIIMASVLFVFSIFTIIEPFLAEINVISIIYSLVSAGFSSVVIYALVDIIICSLKNRKINKENGIIDNEGLNINEEDIT